MLYAIAYDVGTTGVKTCLFAIDDEVRLLAGEYGAYDLFILPNGGAEQDAEQWWDAMCQSTRRLFRKVDIRPDQIGGISFCSQMQGMVLVDREGRALRRPKARSRGRRRASRRTPSRACRARRAGCGRASGRRTPPRRGSRRPRTRTAAAARDSSTAVPEGILLRSPRTARRPQAMRCREERWGKNAEC